MSNTLLSEAARTYKEPQFGRLLKTTAKVYKLADRGEGLTRITLTTPVQALTDLHAITSAAMNAMTAGTQPEALVVLHDAIGTACTRAKRLVHVQRYAELRDDQLVLQTL